MGAGNPLIRSLNEDLYSPTTYFIDFTEFYTEEEKINLIKEDFEANEIESFEDLSEEEIDKEFYQILDFNIESFQNNYFFNLDEKYKDLWSPVHDKEKYLDDCSANFRGSAIILAKSDDCFILTTDEAEIHHYPIALIPSFELSDIEEDVHQENIDKEDWYYARNLDFDEMVQKKALKLYEKKLRKWQRTYEPFMRYFHSHYGKGLSARNGPWTSYSIKLIGKDFKFL